MVYHRHLSVESVTTTQTIILYSMAFLLIIAYALIYLLLGCVNQLQKKVMDLMRIELWRQCHNSPDEVVRMMEETGLDTDR